ncbi:MAG: hypothetical protein AABY68_00190 [Pseudomonadota bacterium]
MTIRDRKRLETRSPLIAAHTLITQRYQSYAQAIASGALAGLQQDTQALLLSAPLRECYTGSTKALEALKKDIKDVQPVRLLKYCPMCGTTLPKTFDHYMPAVMFPELAVHPLNLVPCCSTCNSTKGDNWLSSSGDRQYLHAYTDELPDLQFVTVSLHQIPALRGVGATYSLQQPIGVLNAQWQLIESHFNRLKLIARYDELGNDEIAEILSDCRAHIDAGGPDAREFLAGRATDRRMIYGRNHWIAVLMKAMAHHQDFDDWVNAA